MGIRMKDEEGVLLVLDQAENELGIEGNDVR